MSLSSLNGVAVLSCRVHTSAWGAWYAEVELDRPETIAGRVTLVLSDLTLRGAILAGGPWAGRARYRIVGGAGGWGRRIKEASYANDLGVKLAKVLDDAARECGETIADPPAGVTGPAFPRPEGRAGLVLELLAAEQWYIDEQGVTRFGRRPTRAYTGNATILRKDFASGIIELGANEIAALTPGAVVEGLEALDVEHTLTDGKLRTCVWGKGGGALAASLPDRMRKIVDTLTRHYRFCAPYEYRVVERTGERYAVQPVRVSTGMPSLRNVRVRGGVAGVAGDATPGALVLVSFVDGNPARPVITSFDDPESPGFETARIRLGELGAADALVRQSDLQSAISAVQSKYNSHVHTVTAGVAGVVVAPHVMSITATGSSVVKAGA